MKRPISIDDMLKFTFLSSPLFSPSGKKYAYLSHKMDDDKDTYVNHLHISSEHGEIEEEGVRSYAWLDDDAIIFPSQDKSDDEITSFDGYASVLYKLSANNGVKEILCSLPLPVGQIKHICGRLVFTAYIDLQRPDIEHMGESDRKAAIKAMKKEKDYIILNEAPYWSNGKGITNKRRNAVYSCLLDGTGLVKLSPDYMDVHNFFEHQGNIVFHGSLFEKKRNEFNCMMIASLNGENSKTLIGVNKLSILNACSTGNGIVAAATDFKQFGSCQNPAFYSVTEGKMDIIAEPDISIFNTVGTDCRYGNGTTFMFYGEKIYFTATIGNECSLYSLDMYGNISAIREKPGSVDYFDISSDKLISVNMEAQRLPEIYLGPLNSIDEVVTSYNSLFHSEADIRVPEHFSFTNKEGNVIDCWAMTPHGFIASEKYPAVLYIHGGPKTVFGNVYYHDLQSIAAKGYIVFYCNPTGSDGRGSEFAKIFGRCCTVDYDDVMALTEIVSDMPYVDENRLGVTGGSYGGYMTNWIIGHNEVFKAAVSQRSVGSWLTSLLTCEGGFPLVEDQLSGMPVWHDKSWQKLWDDSPVKYADKVKTPTLFIHSDEDYNTWLVEGLMMYTALIYHNVETKMHIFKGESHGLSRNGKPSHRIRRVEEILQWFEQHLKEDANENI